MIPGGSKGIGLETAKLIAQGGGSLLLIGRTQAGLETAERELDARMAADAFLETRSCDVTDFEALQPILEDFVGRRGTPDYLLNMVGFAYPQYLEHLKPDDFRAAMDGNYLGQLYPTLILLPHFLEAGRGHIAYVFSVMGYMGIIGYAAYAPAKFALVGLAEVLRHELKPRGIHVSVLFPPDTDTPGFEIENRTKPHETAAISSSAKLMQPSDVARIFIQGLLRNRFLIHAGESRLIWHLNRLAPGLLRWFTDRQLRQIRRCMP